MHHERQYQDDHQLSIYSMIKTRCVAAAFSASAVEDGASSSIQAVEYCKQHLPCKQQSAMFKLTVHVR